MIKEAACDIPEFIIDRALKFGICCNDKKSLVNTVRVSWLGVKLLDIELDSVGIKVN